MVLGRRWQLAYTRQNLKNLLTFDVPTQLAESTIGSCRPPLLLVQHSIKKDICEPSQVGSGLVFFLTMLFIEGDLFFK